MAKHISHSFFILISLSFFFIQSSQSSYDHSAHAQAWTHLYTEQMTPEDLQITANMLYCLYSNTLIDLKIQEYFSPLSELSQIVHSNLSDPMNPNNEIAQLRVLTEKIAYLTKIRFLYTKILDNCLNHYNKNHIVIVDDALKALQLYAADSLREWADNNNQFFIEHLENSARVIAECAQSIHSASNTHKALSHEIFPFIVDEKDKSLALINVILRSTPTFMNAAYTTMNTLNNICNDAMKTICFGAHVYKQHYQAVYEIITAESFDKKYATLLFHEQGILPEEYIVLLPDADHVFEHMLETKELFAQAQLK